MTVKLDNTFVICTDDKNFSEAMSIFLSEHCEANKVNVALYGLTEKGAKEVRDIVYEEDSVK